MTLRYDIPVTFRLSAEQFDALESLAEKQQETTVEEYVKILLSEHLYVFGSVETPRLVIHNGSYAPEEDW